MLCFPFASVMLFLRQLGLSGYKTYMWGSSSDGLPSMCVQAVDHADPRSIVDGVVVHGTSVTLQAAVVVPGKFNVKVRTRRCLVVECTDVARETRALWPNDYDARQPR